MMNIKKAKLEKLKEMKKLMEKRNRLLREKIESRPGYGVTKLLEGELERAELTLAAKDVVNRLQDMAEDIAKMQVEDIMPLSDNLKGEFGPDQAEAFSSAANDALTSALDAVKSARENVNNQVLRMEGKLSDEDVAAMATDMGKEEPELEVEPEGEPELEVEPEEEDIFGGEEAAAGEEGEPLGRARKESAENTADALLEAEYETEDGFSKGDAVMYKGKKMTVVVPDAKADLVGISASGKEDDVDMVKASELKKVTESKKNLTKHEQDLAEAVSELREEEVDSLRLELIADRYGLDEEELYETYKDLLDKERVEKVEHVNTPGSAIREALNLAEQTPAAKDIADKILDPDDPAQRRAKQELATAIDRLDPRQQKDLEDKLGEEVQITEHQLVEDIVELAEDEALKLVKERIKYAKGGKGLEARESFGGDIKLSTPKAVVEQLVKKYGDPTGWGVARAPEGTHYVLSGPIPEMDRAKEVEGQIKSLEEEISGIKTKHADVKEFYRLPQEFKVDNLNRKLTELQTGYRHQLAKWLSLEEATALVELARCHSKPKKKK